MKYLIVLEGNGECAAYDSQAVAEGEAKRLSVKAGAHFIAVPSRENPAAPQLLAACQFMVGSNGHYYACLAGQRGSGECSTICKILRAAIAAAEGRE